MVQQNAVICYYRKVTLEDDPVDVEPFDFLEVTAGQFLESTYIVKIADRLRRELRAEKEREYELQKKKDDLSREHQKQKNGRWTAEEDREI